MRRGTTHALYRRVLGLYPRAFRERLGESMEQTFADLYGERKRRSERGLFGFVLWIFVETAVGAIREHAFRIRQGDHMKLFSNPMGSAALIGVLLVLPFVLLELAFTGGAMLYDPPLVLFGLLWLLAAAFILILTPTVRTLRAGSAVLANSMTLLLVLLRVAFLALLLSAWGGIVLDQLPCFLGVPNCD